MRGFIPIERYIKKETHDCGVGVIVSCDEKLAIARSSRMDGVRSFNQWLSVDIPGTDELLDIGSPVTEQPRKVLDGLRSRDFLKILFMSDFRKFIADAGHVENGEALASFFSDRYERICSFSSGLSLFSYINGRCRTHDPAISSSLLYSAGIKGACVVSGGLLLYNAKKDIEVIDCMSDRILGANVL